MAQFLLTVSAKVLQDTRVSISRDIPIRVNIRGLETWDCLDSLMPGCRRGRYNASEKKGFSGSAYFNDEGREVFRLLDFFPLNLDPNLHRPGSEFSGSGTGQWISAPIPVVDDNLEWTVISKDGKTQDDF
jgi:hypothetical protein